MKANILPTPLSVAASPVSDPYSFSIKWFAKKLQPSNSSCSKLSPSSRYQCASPRLSSRIHRFSATGMPTRKSPPRQSQFNTACSTVVTNSLGIFTDYIPYLSHKEMKRICLYAERKSNIGTDSIKLKPLVGSNESSFTYHIKSFNLFKSEKCKFNSNISPRLNAIEKEHSINPLQILKEWKDLEEKNKNYKKKLRDKVLSVINKLQQLDLTPDELINYKVISTKPFEKPFSKDFIKAAKEGKLEEVKKILKNSKYLVYDFDYTHKTALHWSVIRGKYDVMSFLIESHSDIDAKDLSLKTPLHFAAKCDDLRAAEVCNMIGTCSLLELIRL